MPSAPAGGAGRVEGGDVDAISAEDAQKLTTVGEAVTYINERMVH